VLREERDDVLEERTRVVSRWRAAAAAGRPRAPNPTRTSMA
jgi:hypothetical protein